MRIELQDVAVERDRRQILAALDLAVPSGRALVITGRSGSGLSVLLKTAAGLLTPSRGCVLHDGRRLDALGGREFRRMQTRSGFVFQDAALWANLSIAANLELPLQAKYPDLGAAERRRRVERALADFSLAVDLQARPAMLSEGERHLVSFLRAVVPGPEALFLDEPTAAVDDHWRGVILDRLRDLKRAGVTLLAASRDPGLATALADETVVLDCGRAAPLVKAGQP